MRQAPIVIAVYATLAITLGGQWIAAKLGLNAVPALELSTMRFAIASGVLLAACAITRTPIPLHRWRPIAAAAACGVLGFNTLAFVGLSRTPVSDSALIIPTTIPMATALFATLIHERLTSRKLFGFAVATVGAALVIAGGQQSEGGSESSTIRLGGDLMELGAATAWAASLTIGATVLRKESVLGYVTFMVVIGTAMLLTLGALP
jgi:drug/metabolite transporter (DMT)-like permease